MYNQVVWLVWGDPNAIDGMPCLWETKLDAERYARECFPDMHPDLRYARIYYKEVMNYER